MVNSIGIILFWKCPSNTVSPNFGKTEIKLSDRNSLNIQAISNKIKYWNLNCYIGINLPLSSCEGETKTVWCHLDMSSTNLQNVNKYIYIY